MRTLFLLFAGLLASVSLHSEPKYRVADIPKNLLADAKAVIRKDESVFEIIDIGKGVYKVTKAITILNQNGIDNSLFVEFYNKFLTVRKVEWNLFDQNGNPIKNNSSVELQDYTAISGYSIYEDNRVKFVDPKFRTTPFTIEYKYEVGFNGLLFFPKWSLYEDYNISVEQTSLTVIVPAAYQLRYFQKNLQDSCIITTGKEKITYSWNAVNKLAIREEPFSASLEEYTPVVYIAPADFEFAGFRGNLQSWDNFSNWITTLGKGRDILIPESSEKIKSLIADKRTDLEKIDALYSYMQSKVRYVSIQVGIGGWQTIDAETVDRLSYGDCKALSNYMKTLLGVAGIKSFYTLVKAGEDSPDLLKNFPSNQFNHAILCVPLEKDTIWLECTSQHLPTGYLGTFTDDRKVLLTGEGGGKLVQTKKYKIDNNHQTRSGTIFLSSSGNAESKITTKYNGTLYDDIYQVLHLDGEDRKKFMQKRIRIKSFNLLSFNHTENRNIIPSITEEIELELPNYSTIIAGRMLINPNLMTRFGSLPYRTKERKSVIRIKRPYIQTDTLEYKLPMNYIIEQVPENISLKTKFGEYSTEISYDSKVMKYIRRFKLFSGDYPASDYEEFVVFCEKISSIDEKKSVVMKII